MEQKSFKRERKSVKKKFYSDKEEDMERFAVVCGAGLKVWRW